MNRETIEKAADEFAEREYETNGVDRDYLHKGFYHGARWRINAAWHDAGEKPKFNGKVEETEFLVLRETGQCGRIQAGKDDWDDVVGLTKFVKWAYAADLLPDGKEIRP